MFSNQLCANKKNGWCYGLGKEVKTVANYTAVAFGLRLVAPQELYILTQIILNTLNTESDQFHDMSELPGLENHDPNQLSQVAGYLLKQGWVEVKAIETILLIKLTMPGKMFVGNTYAWA